MTPSTVPVVALEHVSLLYGEVKALDDVSLEVQPGASLAIVGRSGSGKSSLLAVMGLMRAPTAGSVYVNGVRAQTGQSQRAALRQAHVGMVFQSYHLDTKLTALENCLLPWLWTSRGGTSSQVHRRAEELLQLVGIGHLAGRKVYRMSGGERQRVAIARALFASPDIVIADEPTGNLDEENAETIATILYSLPKSTGCAVVVVTHDRHVAAGADRRIALTRGTVESGMS